MKPQTFLFAVVCSIPALADEGMWLLNQFPKDQVRKKHGVTVTEDFLRHLQLSSVRVGSSGSGSFVSPDGLIFTNHHVASDCVFQLSSAQHNYIRDGFYAAANADEKKCPGLEVNVLQSIEDVTARVNAGVTPGMPGAEANQKRKAASAVIEKGCTDSKDRRCEVVTLYSGGLYHLYRYKSYIDICLVFAPEESIAAFGGDPDNFTYPRYDYDLAFLRAYESGKPVKVEHFLKWSKQGVKEKELTFVSGHPGTTGRLDTVAQLEFARDVSMAKGLAHLKWLEAALLKYGERGEEFKRQSRDLLFSYQNSIKARTGFSSGLQDDKLLARKREDEKKLRAAVAKDPARQREFGDAWDKIAASQQEFRQFYVPYLLLEARGLMGSDLYSHARHIVRLAEEKKQPNERRLQEYSESSMPSLLRALYSEAPIYEQLEIAMLAANLEYWVKESGASDPTVQAVLNGLNPAEAAEGYVKSSKLKDIAERKRLVEEPAALAATSDGMIRLARLIEPRARELRKRYEDHIEAVLTGNGGKIARARFAIYGTSEYPDATFTMRVTFGPAKGYETAQGKWIPWAADFAGMYNHATGVEPFKLPDSWLKAKSSLSLRTPYNYVTTCDTHGGNSGSPTVNRKGEVIGILFDGNIEGLPNRYVYTEEQARSVHVASQGIIEGLRKVYKTAALLKELGF